MGSRMTSNETKLADAGGKRTCGCTLISSPTQLTITNGIGQAI